MSSRVWLVGYERRSLADLLALLRAEGVRRVLDVRGRPESRKPGFSSRELEGHLRSGGIEYDGFPELGCDPAARWALHHGGSREAFESAYRQRLETSPGAWERLRDRVASAPTALLCTERRAEDCHRRVLGERLAQEGWTVVAL